MSRSITLDCLWDLEGLHILDFKIGFVSAEMKENQGFVSAICADVSVYNKRGQQ